MRYTIGQKAEQFIIKAINKKFKMASRVRESEPGFFRTETGGREALGNVKEHFERYPLLGEKAVDFQEFKEKYELGEKSKF